MGMAAPRSYHSVHARFISAEIESPRHALGENLVKVGGVSGKCHSGPDHSVYSSVHSSLETRPSPSSTRACSVRYNYAWEYFRREKAWYILSRDACQASSCGAVA